MTTEIIPKKENLPATSFDRFIELAINKNVPVETIERLLAMQKDIMAVQARAAYDEAMRAFQKDCPIIQKHKEVKNKGGLSVRYVYAPLDDIIEQVKIPLYDHGFSYRIGQEVDKPKPGWMTVYCTATHAQGHSETERFELPLGSAEFMTAQQEVGAARTFGSRYCFLGVFGIMTGDEDTDANPPEKNGKTPTERLNEQLKQPPVSPTGNTPPDGGELKAVGFVENIEDLPKKNGKGFRYKFTLTGQAKPFYSWDKKLRDYINKWSTSGEVSLVYTVGKFGQDIKTASFSDPNADFSKFCEEKGGPE